MKIKIVPLISWGGALLAIAALAGCASPNGKSAVRVTEEKQYIQPHHVRDTSQPVALKKGDAMAMACTQCRMVYRPVINPATWPYPPLWGSDSARCFSGWQRERLPAQDWSQRHYCPGCKSTITTTGTWLNRKESVKHTCTACGDESLFCCATAKGAPPTGGMEIK